MPPRGPASFARTLFAFFFASTLIVSAGAYVTFRTLGRAQAAGLLEVVTLLGGALPLGLAYVLTLRLRQAPLSPDAAEWWRVNLGKAVLLWSLAEGSCLLAAAALLAAGTLFSFVLLVAAALAGLLLLSPGRLAPG